MKAIHRLCCTLGIALATIAQGATHYVDSRSRTPVSPYVTRATASQTIQPAIDAASPGELVLIRGGTYAPAATIALKDGVTVEGESQSGVVVDGQGSIRCFEFLPSKTSTSATLRNLTVENGDAGSADGGGLFCSTTGAVTVERCTFRDNSADEGGALCGEHIEASFCSFFGNRAENDYSGGGGMNGGTAINCLFVDNGATYGGAMRGGSAYHCTATRNEADANGGGFEGVSVFNSIVWGNAAGSDGNDIWGGTAAYTCASSGVSNGLNGCITANPLLVDPSTGDYHPFRTSNCIDAGDNAEVRTTEDLDGNVRTYKAASGGTTDMGAYEFCGYRAVTFHVNHSIPDGSYPYTSSNSPATDLDQVKNLWQDDDRVVVYPGTYYRYHPITVSKRIVLSGIDDGSGPPVLYGSTAQSSFVSAFSLFGDCLIQGIEFRHFNQAAVICTNEEPTLENCIFSENRKRSGSTLYGAGMQYGTAVGCTFLSNSADRGGGMYQGIASNCVFSENSAGEGGAVYSTELHNSLVSSNSADNGGGAHSASAYDCLFIENSAETGGAIYMGTAKGCTIVSNHASTYAGGASEASLYGSIVWGNTLPSAGIHVTGADDCIQGGLPGGFVRSFTNDPCFLSEGTGNYRLRIDSPCIDLGSDDPGGALDFDGNPRVAGAKADMGAYEFSPQAGADTDGDGLPDTWEYDQFAGNADPAEDADDDRFDNRSEYVAGTDPNDASAFLRIVSCTLTNAGAQMNVVWSPSVSGRIYGISSSTNLTEGFSADGTAWAYPADSALVTNVDANAFYKINVRIE